MSEWVNYRKRFYLCVLMERLPKTIHDDASFRSACVKAKSYQRDWREIGHTPRKLSDTQYRRFRNAADVVFQKKDKR